MIVTLTSDAEADVKGATDFYHLIDPALAQSLVDEIRDALERIAANPYLYQRVHPLIRRGLTHRFPFAIYYTADPAAIGVIAVLHTSRNPKTWRKRMPDLGQSP